MYLDTYLYITEKRTPRLTNKSSQQLKLQCTGGVENEKRKKKKRIEEIQSPILKSMNIFIIDS